MDHLTRDIILGAQDLHIERVEVPEWGGFVFVRGMTGAERDAFEDSIVKMRDKSVQVSLRDIRAKLVAMCVIDEKGNRIFNDDDVIALGRKSAKALARLADKIQELSGLTNMELAKNLKNDQNVGSGSD